MSLSERTLREAIVESFSAEELDTLRADLEETLASRGVKVQLSVEALGGKGQAAQVLKLIEALKHRGQLPALIDAVRAARPGLLQGGADAAPPANNSSATAPTELRVAIRMPKIPTSIYHLLNKNEHPLVTCEVRNAADQKRNVRVTSHIDVYSVEAVDSGWVIPQQVQAFNQLPRLRPAAMDGQQEMAPGTLNVKLEDLTDTRVLAHQTFDVYLYPNTTVPLEIQDALTGEWRDMTPFIGAFVTPNAPAVRTFIRDAGSRLPEKQFLGYQKGPGGVGPQVQALFEAFKGAGIIYNSFVQAFGAEPGVEIQRVQLPRESLKHALANCIDGLVLFASALEGIGLSAALVFIQEPAGGHALVGWETMKGNGEWRYLDTTKIATHTFEQASAAASNLATAFEAAAAEGDDPRLFRRWALPTLRTERQITPME